MCGIVGALAFGKSKKEPEEKARQEAMLFIATQLLQMTVERGKDATGVSVLFNDGNYAGLKMGIPSPEFIARYGTTEEDYEGLLKLIRDYAKPMRMFLGHCRKATVGNSYDNKNNQPVQVGDIVLIHNGTLDNHNIIFEKLACERTGDVDSEAIARLMHHYSNNGQEPFTMDMLDEVTKRIDGSYSVLGFSGNNPYQMFQMRDLRPAEMILIRPLKAVFVASEKKFIENTLYEYNKFAKLFAQGLKLPYLRKEHVDFETLPDDSHALWDLTVEIADDTNLKDLFTTRKNVITGQKLWKAPTKTTTYVGGGGTHYGAGGTGYQGGAGSDGWTGASSQKPAAESVAPKSNKAAMDDDDDSEDTAYVWNDKLNAYAKETGGSSERQDLNVEISSDSGKIDTSGLEVETPEEAENLVNDPAKVVEHVASDKQTVKHAEAMESGGPIDPNTGVVVEVDLSVDAQAIKKAEEFVGNGLTKFEKDDEVLEVLEVKHADSLKNLPLFALSNRIMTFLAKKFFYEGYKARKKEETIVEKGAVVEKKIRVLKILTKILAKTLDASQKPKKIEKRMAAVLKEMPRIVNTLGPEDVSAVLTRGDTKTSTTLSTLNGQLKEISAEKKE
jgi:hypothetical protein